jgi:anti-sigma B factor antagonist
MEITVTNFGNRAQRLVLVGDLDISGAEKLDLPLATLAGAGGNLVIDMTRLDGVAAIGIRHLVCAARALRRDSGQLLLLGPNPIVANMLRTARVDDLLPIARSEDEAREALGSCNRSDVATGQ